jgi:hypothetical protein
LRSARRVSLTGHTQTVGFAAKITRQRTLKIYAELHKHENRRIAAFLSIVSSADPQPGRIPVTLPVTTCG